MGLRGKVPPVGADLFGAGPYHLPLPEGEGIAGGRCDGALIYKDFSGVLARLRRTGRHSSPLGNGAAIANVNATPRSNDELALLSMSATAMESTTVESSGMESAKGMAAAEMSSSETMAEEVVSSIVVSPIVAAEVAKKPVADVGTVKRAHKPVPSASAEQKDGGNSY